MKGELVSILTADRVRLEGMWLDAAEQVPQTTTDSTTTDAAQTVSPPQIAQSFDAAVISHGLGGNFYGARLLRFIARALLDRGISCVLANNRGHDLINWTSRSARLTNLGAAYETVGECVHDLEGWADFLVRKGHARVLLVGHSLGAIKTLFAAAHQVPQGALGIIGLSATRLNYDRLLSSRGGDKFQKMIATAEEMIAAGRGDDLMKVEFPFATWMAAGAYLEKYGPPSRYDWIGFADKVRLPTLLMYGSDELTGAAFSGMEDDLAGVCAGNPAFQSQIIDGADHYYSLRYETMWQVAARWLDDFPARESATRQTD